MRKALFDRSSIIRISAFLHSEGTNKITKEFENFIYATILWDEICFYIDGPTQSVNIRTSRMMGNLFNALEGKGIVLLKEEIQYYYFIVEQLKKTNLNASLQEIQDLADVIFYENISSMNGADLYVSKERQKIIARYNLSNRDAYNRLEPIFTIEKDIMEYHKEFRDKYGIKGIKIETPLLIDYVVSQSENSLDAIQVARQISKEPDVIAFRKAMNDLEECLYEGAILEADRYLQNVKEVVPSLKEHYLAKRKVKATIGLQLGWPLLPTIGLEDMHIRIPDYKHSRHMNFLIRLAEYGLMKKYKPVFSIPRWY